MDVGTRPNGGSTIYFLRLMLVRFSLTVAIGFTAAVAWEFLFDDAAHGILGIPPDSVAEHWRYVLYETAAIAAVAAAYAYRIRYELAMEEALAKYTAVMHGANDAILIGDLDGNIIDANPQAERLLGRTRDELLKMNFRQIYPPEAVNAAEASFK
ncbi:MAG: PAS domain S-box protein, partial [Candidatus Nitrosotenuis sp.]